MTISNKKTKHVRLAEKFLDFVFLKNHLYIGLKIKAKITPKIIESKIGFIKKNDKTISTNKMMVLIIFLKYSEYIFSL